MHILAENMCIYPPTRMAKMKKPDKNKYCQRCEVIRTLIHCLKVYFLSGLHRTLIKDLFLKLKNWKEPKSS